MKTSHKLTFSPYNPFLTIPSELVATCFPQKDDGVPPNGRHTYIWEVKPEHGPTSNDSDCLTWAYHSHINPRSDVNTGLVGSLFEIGTLRSTTRQARRRSVNIFEKEKLSEI